MIQKIKSLFNNKKIIISCFSLIALIGIIILSAKVFNVSFAEKDFIINDAKITGYETNGKELVSTTSDSRIEIASSNLFLSSLQIFFDKPLEQDSNISIYYNTGKGYSENEKSFIFVKKGDTQSELVIVNVPISSIRIDFGDKIGETFTITKIKCNGEQDLILNQKTIYYNKIFLIYFIVILIIASTTIIFKLLKKLSKNQISVEKVCTVIIFVFGLTYLISITPFSPPDEDYHYRSAYKLSNVMLLEIDSLNQADAQHYNLEGFVGHYNSKDSYNRIAKDIFQKDKGSGFIDLTERSDSLSFPLFYLPQAIGISFSRILNLNMIWVFYLGRLCNLLFFTVMAYYSIKSIPKYKILVFIVLFLPMTLQQAVSFSYDSYINALSVFFVCNIFKSIYDNQAFSKKEHIKYIVLAFIFAPAKIVYFWLFLLLFLIPHKRFANKLHYFIKILTIFVSGFFAIIITSLTKITLYSDVSGLNWEGYHNYSISFILNNPITTLSIFVNTIYEYGFWYITTAFGSSLSGLTLQINMIYIFAFIVLFFVSTLKTSSDNSLVPVRKKVIAFISISVTFIFVLLAMFLSWTSDYRDIIQGVQGRYFIPILIQIGILMSSENIYLKKSIDKKIIICSAILQCFVVFDIIKHTFNF